MTLIPPIMDGIYRYYYYLEPNIGIRQLSLKWTTFDAINTRQMPLKRRLLIP